MRERLGSRRKATQRARLASIVLLVMLASSCFFIIGPAPSIAIAERFLQSSNAHWLGTDHYGRDNLVMILRGGFWSLTIAFSAVALAMLCAIPLGLLAAHTTKIFLQRALLSAADLLFAFPAILTALLITALYKPGLLAVLVAITLLNIPVFLRLTFAAAQSLYRAPFISAARALGASDRRILLHHILPNILTPLLLHASTQVALAILVESALAYLGLSLPPPNASWGVIVREAQNFMEFSKIPIIATASLIFATVMACSTIARAYSSHEKESLL